MNQLLQHLKSGHLLLEDIPCPHIAEGHIRIQTRKTLVSAGTERMLLEFGKGNLLQKARQQPEKVKQVLEKIKSDGLLPTLDAVRNKLDTPLALGYCNVGKVIESRVAGFCPGDRVVSNGKHAEVVVVPKNLCAKVPDGVDDESAAFTVIGAIALQGIRLLQPTLGETVVVTGLGLIGLVAVQLLRAHGCRVMGIDLHTNRTKLAQQFGAETVNLSEGEDPIATARRYSRERGVDAVLITASSRSNAPIHQAASMCRKKGRIVLVGTVGMQMTRTDFYEKELSFQVSCSYGPGRYDPEYEEKGHDYPIGHVRWTEQRNFEAVLDMMADGRIDMTPLISHRFKLRQAVDAYELISRQNPLGVLLSYGPHSADLKKKVIPLAPLRRKRAPLKTVLGFIGAGNYASAVLVPAFGATGARMKAIASATGISSVQVGRKNNVEMATTDATALIDDPEISAVVISTRHDSHARWVSQGLHSGKHVFVEKPLSLTASELQALKKLYANLKIKPLLMVGFNRRYAPHVQMIKAMLKRKAQPKSFVMTVNAGAIPFDHWTQDKTIGGGRLIGEGCHFIDLLRFLAGAPIERICAVAMDAKSKDSLMLHLRFADGSIGALNYLSNGSKTFPKERLEVFCGGAILQLNNYRSLKGYGWPGFHTDRLWRQDKGQRQCAQAFVDAVTTGKTDPLIPIEELFEVAEACFEAAAQIG